MSVFIFLFLSKSADAWHRRYDHVYKHRGGISFLLGDLERIYSQDFVKRAKAGYSSDKQEYPNDIQNDTQSIVFQDRPANDN
jgi:hypothetical protein